MAIAKRLLLIFLAALAVLMMAEALLSYPIDGYKKTGIRRLKRLSLVMADSLRGSKPPPGGRLLIEEIHLNLLGERGDSLVPLPAPDPELQKAIEGLFPNRHESYSLALLDITPGQPVRFAQRQADRQFNPGSVGKLAIAAGLFSELQRLFPNDVSKRAELMRTRMIVADRWSQPNHHEIPVFDPADRSFAVRPVRLGDTFSLYEWADHMLSASSNAAASTVWKELLLMRKFGAQYPPTPEREKAFFDQTPKDSLRMLAVSIVNEPLRRIGIADNEWKLGSFFTATGKKIVPGEGSYGTPRGLLKYLVALERGQLVDDWSSLEIKRLIYLTARRIRYASSPALEKAAVYFKSGSLYRCKPEEGFECGKYRGNVDNMMNSVAIVEQPEGRTYLVALMSNVLKKNSAVEHQTLATYIDRILAKIGPQKVRPEPPPPPPPLLAAPDTSESEE